ncbi:MAG: DUF3810 domain-containing protein [Lachnospiraceae bacterium]|nr:DUF3810 domain-containing protein [Lachnospiraceae bacterium]
MKALGKNKRFLIYGIALVVVIIWNVIAWFSPAYCDWHIKYILPIWLNTYGRLTSLVSFSVGEIMLLLAVVISVFGIVLLTWNLICRDKYRKVVNSFWGVYAWIVLVVLYVMTANCSVFYHASDFTEKYGRGGRQNDEAVREVFADRESYESQVYTKENLAILRDYIVTQCNMLAEEIAHDEQGDAVYEGDLIIESTKAMRKLGERYGQLSGFYVKPKYLTASAFFSQQSILGYYFPFSLEANMNSMMYITNVPSTACHELSHTKGFLFEDDANMIAFLACTQSDDVFLQYSGYLSVLNYVNNEFYDSVGRNREEYFGHVRISEVVSHDNIFLTEENQRVMEEKAVIKTETVKEVSQTLMDTTLKLNGVEEGRQQYDKVVNLLLDYYYGVLY